MQRVIIVILTIVLCGVLPISKAFAGDNDDKKKKEDKTDPYKSTAVWEPIPLTRQGFHSYIDKSQIEADEFDGFLDGVILLENKATRTKKITEAIITKPNQIQIIIENLPIDNREKLLYLKELNVCVKTFNGDYMSKGKEIDEEFYLEMMTSFLDIMRIEIEKKDMVSYIDNDFNLGIYANLPMYNDNRAAVEAVYKHMVDQYPDKMLYKLREFANTEAADKLIANTAKKSPNIILTYAKSTSIERDIVMRSKDPLVMAITGLATKTTNSLKALPFIDDVTSGNLTYDDLNKIIANQKKALLITDLIGRGSDTITGDYSIGASGILIENGEFSHSVNEITIAGNLLDMYKNLTLANDLEFIYATNSASILINQMTIAGK